MADTNPPPVTNPPADPPPPNPPTPPTPPAPAPPSGDAPGWVQGLVDAVGAIPEKVASAVREQTPAPPPPPVRKTGDEHREDGERILDAARKPPDKSPAGSTPRRRTFADRWFGT
jgi:hypothetical protein